VFSLAWRNVDLERGCLRLDPGTTKNGEGRLAYLPAELVEAFRAHRAAVEAVQRRLERVIPDVFVHLDGSRAGEPWGDFRKRWAAACEAAGVPGLIVHDLRRSGVRNMVRAGIGDGVAMRISGHRTRSVFDRYNVTTEADLEAAAARLGHSFGHSRAPRVDRKRANGQNR
jgi:integrase